MSNENKVEGEVYRVSGPLVIAKGLESQMYNVIKVGDEQLLGEVIKISGEKTFIQVYEDTTGIKPGEPVKDTEQPLSVELGPGILSSIYDGLQRPLPNLKEKQGDFITRGTQADGVSHSEMWEFSPKVSEGDEVAAGGVVGTVEEKGFEHKIMLPPEKSGVVKEVKEGEFTVEDTVAVLEDGYEVKMSHQWSIREPRPYKKKLEPTVPLVTGQRILDGLFPIAKGGAAAIPGGFGTGKTVTQHQLAKWSDADIIIFIGCGERGNEMTEVLKEFPELEDPHSDSKLMDRTVLIANTSNMPVAAREASIYTGITIAEYFRDQGYSVALMADSTSRWAEAMREISSRLEEMPGERGFPAYLASRLAAFYERGGRVTTNCDETGSVTTIGAVSPPGGDFTEPVTQNTLRVVQTFWALDKDLANKRHFPAISWTDSYSGYEDSLSGWFEENVSDKWTETVKETKDLLQQDEKLQETVQLVGSDALPEGKQLKLEVARMVKEFFLQQNAFHDIDTFSSPEKTFKILESILEFGEKAEEALEDGVDLEEITGIESRTLLGEVRFRENFGERIEAVEEKMEEDFEELRGGK